MNTQNNQVSLSEREICIAFLCEQIKKLGFSEAVKAAAWTFKTLPMIEVIRIGQEVEKVAA